MENIVSIMRPRFTPTLNARDFSQNIEKLGLVPLFEGSMQIPLGQVSDPTFIKKILKSSMAMDEARESDLEGMKKLLGGGLALYDDQDLKVWPQCCGELSDIEGWRKAATQATTEWKMLWIGHPWISYRQEGEWLLLSDYHEDAPPSTRWKVNPAALFEAVENAQRDVDCFLDRAMQAARQKQEKKK